MKITGSKSSWSSGMMMAITIIAPISVSAENNREIYDSVPPSRHNRTYVTKVSGGGLRSTGLAVNNGKLWVWGYRGHGLAGNDDKTDTKEPPQLVKSLKNIVRIAGGTYHLMALDEKGDLYGWGKNTEKQVGCGKKGHYFATPCILLHNVTYMDASQHMSIAVTEDGKVYTWGDASYGASGDKKNQPVPLEVNYKINFEKARLVGAAWQGLFAITVNDFGKHTVWAWGDNEAAGLALPSKKHLGSHDIRKNPERVVALDPYAERIVYIGGGNGWGEALLNDGTVIGWGAEIGLGSGSRDRKIYSHMPKVIMTGVERLYARYRGSVALTYDGKVYVWGQETGKSYRHVFPASLTKPVIYGRAVSIGGGQKHIYYINHRGEMYGIGKNHKGQAGPRFKGRPQWPGAGVPIDDWENGIGLDF